MQMQYAPGMGVINGTFSCISHPPLSPFSSLYTILAQSPTLSRKSNKVERMSVLPLHLMFTISSHQMFHSLPIISLYLTCFLVTEIGSARRIH